MIQWNRPPIRPIEEIIAYYRLDEPEPDKSDTYGFEDQQRDVARFAADRNATIVREFFEVAAGEKSWEQRAELDQAIVMSQVRRATLVIGRQDRLACTVHIISGLTNAELDFVSVDNPDRGPFQKQMRAILDEHGCIPGAEL